MSKLKIVWGKMKGYLVEIFIRYFYISNIADKDAETSNIEFIIESLLSILLSIFTYNYFISKNTENNKTKTSIKTLNEEETIKEIARIASGTLTNAALEHARELRSA